MFFPVMGRTLFIFVGYINKFLIFIWEIRECRNKHFGDFKKNNTSSYLWDVAPMSQNTVVLNNNHLSHFMLVAGFIFF